MRNTPPDAPDATGVPETLKPASVTQQAPIPRPSKTLPAGIVPDAKWPGMYRVVRPDGSLSEMVNLTRARDTVGQSL